MRAKLTLFAGMLVLLAIVAFGKGGTEVPTESKAMTNGAEETAVIAGGCFWGVEAVFERLEGVYDVMSGYSGGKESTASYNEVAYGKTDHAESVQIIFDPEVIPYATILEVFFSVAHDPTQLNYQGPDVGRQYRSAIFYANDEQQKTAESYIRELDKSDMYGDPIVTELVPLEAFYPAEEYHQDFMERNPNQPYIVYWDRPKIAKLEKEYPHLLMK